MSSSYEFFLCDDYGRKIIQLEKYSFASYSRTTNGYGTIQFGLPYDYYKAQVPDVFKPDWRIDVWRSPEDGFPMRREGSFLLRKLVVYERIDGMRVIEFFGRSPIDILRRTCVCAGNDNPTAFEKNGPADDIMKEIVTREIYDVAPDGLNTTEFFIDGDISLGPIVDVTCQSYEVLDILRDIKNMTLTLNLISPTLYRKIYFDVVEDVILSNGGFAYRFKTFADLRGQDRTNSGLVFSTENGNLGKPSYYEDYLDQITKVGVGYEFGADCKDYKQMDERFLSRWSNIARCITANSTDLDIQRRAYTELAKGRVQKVLNADFLNTPGGPNQPRSLYGMDWDMGDLVRAEFADKSFDVEIKIVYVSVDENGKENVLGSSEIAQ